ncbi:MAG: ABC transporter substrate-binding protein [Acidimicrobiales bacterium]
MKPNRRLLALCALALLVATACGTRVSDQRLRAAAFIGDVQSSTTTNATAAGAPGAAATATTQPSSTAGGGVVSGGGGATTGGGAASAAGDSSAGGAAGAPAAAGPATGSEVAIGVLGTFNGPVGVYVKDFATAVQVWGNWVNDHGGLNNHRVKVVVADDGGSPATFNSKAQQLVEQDHVLAFAFTTLGLAPGGNNAYLDSVGVPTFGQEGGLNKAYEDPYVLTAVPTGDTNAQAMMRGFAKAVASKGLSKIAILSCSDFSLCDNYDRQWSSPELQQATGLQVVYRARPSLTTPDFTSICIDARNAGAEGILNGLDTASLNRLADACARQGYHPIIGLADLLARPELAVNPNADGAVVGTKMAPWFDARVPGIVTMTDAFAQYLPGSPVNGTLAAGWLAARFLQAAAASLPAGNPTSKDFVDGLAGLNGTTLDGLTYPLNFTPGQPSPRVLCYSAAVVSNKTFVSVPGAPLDCA